MADPATHRVTVDGLEMDLDDNGEIVRVWSEPAPSCEPTYALSHRWNWPDANGVMRCACGLRSDLDSHHEYACRIYAPRFSADRGRNHAFQNIDLDTDDVSPFAYDPDPVEAERQRCERLGVEWVGPDVQEMPNGDEERIEAFLRGHGVTVVELDGCMNGRWARESIVRSDLEELRALDEGRIESPRWLTMSAYADSGGIHRLGCELREADGVRALCLRSGMTKRMRGWPSQTHGSTLENGSWRPDSTLRAFGSVGRMRIESR